jgi:hypothetical protein
MKIVCLINFLSSTGTQDAVELYTRVKGQEKIALVEILHKHMYLRVGFFKRVLFFCRRHIYIVVRLTDTKAYFRKFL